MNKLNEFFKGMDWNKVRVKRYPNLIFICGGKLDYQNIRSSLLSPEFKYYNNFVIAENAMNWVDAKAFASDFLELEEYFASVVNLILIISESPGALAEMGAFISNNFVKKKVLVAIEEQHYKENSFIRYGLLQNLQGKSVDPTYQICVLPDVSEPTTGKVNITVEKKQEISLLIKSSIENFKTKTIKFDITKLYSRILLLFDVIFLSNALEKKDLFDFYYVLLRTNFNSNKALLNKKNFEKEFDRMLFILEKVKLLSKQIRGQKIFYTPTEKNTETFLKYPKNAQNHLATEIKKEIKDTFFDNRTEENSIKVALLYNNKKTRAEKLYKDIESFNLDKILFNKAPLLYKTFFIPKKNGGKREIAQPTNLLKHIQRETLKELNTDTLPIHSSAKAYKKNINGILQNAFSHVKNKYFLKLDFSDFFHSIKAKDFNYFLEKQNISLSQRIKFIKIFFMFNKNNGNTNHVYKLIYNTDISDENYLKLITEIYPDDFRLSIGAPSSPTISNIMLYEFDKKISDLTEKNNIIYTRYADDLTFSSLKKENLEKVQEYIQIVLNDIPYLHLKINNQKTKKLSFKNRVSITGLNITPDQKISIGRKQKKKIRAMVYLYSKDKLSSQEIMYLKGWLSYIKEVENTYYISLKEKYSNINNLFVLQ